MFERPCSALLEMGLTPSLGEEKYKTGRMGGRLKSDLGLALPRDTASSAQTPLSHMSFLLGGEEWGREVQCKHNVSSLKG